MTDHYSTLGVVPSADPAVIKAAYRALAAIYHPDKNNSPEACEIIKAINIAYEILSNPEKRKQYDGTWMKSEPVKPSEFESAAQFTDDQIERAWEIAAKFHPTITSCFVELGRISWRLAFSFKLKLIEEKSFGNSRTIAEDFKKEYLSRFFGDDPLNQQFAEELIKAREIQAAIHLNEIVSVMGPSASPWEIKRKVFDQFAASEIKLSKRKIYAGIKITGYYTDHHQAELLVKIHHGTVTRTGFFRRIIHLDLNGECKSFDSDNEFALHVAEIYEKDYS